VSNTRRLPRGHVPAAFARDGQEVPPSPDVAEANLAHVIGEAVALHLAQVLGPMLQQMPWHPACVLCVQACKQAELDYQTAVEVAVKAAEPTPEMPEVPPIAQAVTWLPLAPPGAPPSVLPVCYGHFQAGPAVRPTGLLTPSGQPIIARA
jgi:hypothetical protein